jgi:putative two-component system response regulator
MNLPIQREANIQFLPSLISAWRNISIPQDPANVLIVDDNPINREILVDFVESMGLNSTTAENGISALARIREPPADLLLLDIMMPEMDGHSVLACIKGEADLQDIPVIMISALDDFDLVARCLELGAEDYMIKPFNTAVLRVRINTALERRRLRRREREYLRLIERHSLDLEARVQDQIRRLSVTHFETIFAMSKLAESRDPETGEHIARIREYCKTLSQNLMGIPEYASTIDQTFLDVLYAAAPLHDIGKVGIPDRILLKPGKLTPEEFTVMKTHTTIGAMTLRSVAEQHPGNALMTMGIQIAEHHHERWDGKGYPHGLAEEEIPLAARILALGDVYDALTSRRVYKEAFSHDKSCSIILAEQGAAFDPRIVEVFRRVQGEFQAIRESLAEPGDA